MAKEDILLREEMGRLEIEPTKLRRSKSEENPFYNFLSHRKRGLINKSVPCGQCSCMFKKKVTSNGIFKKKNSKILNEQILKICVNPKVEKTACDHELNISNQNVNIDTLSLCTLVKNCNKLKISCGVNEKMAAAKFENDKTKWWKNDIVCSRENKEQRHSNQTGSCSQQALNPPCDVTIDELASYFETLVHIPKKMSTMAEMMYI